MLDIVPSRFAMMNLDEDANISKDEFLKARPTTRCNAGTVVESVHISASMPRIRRWNPLA